MLLSNHLQRGRKILMLNTVLKILSCGGLTEVIWRTWEFKVKDVYCSFPPSNQPLYEGWSSLSKILF